MNDTMKERGFECFKGLLQAKCIMTDIKHSLDRNISGMLRSRVKKSVQILTSNDDRTAGRADFTTKAMFMELIM